MHPYQAKFKSTSKEKVREVAGTDKNYEFPEDRAERIAGESNNVEPGCQGKGK